MKDNWINGSMISENDTATNNFSSVSQFWWKYKVKVWFKSGISSYDPKMLVLSQSYSKYCLARFLSSFMFHILQILSRIFPQEIQILLLGQLVFQGFSLKRRVGVVWNNSTLEYEPILQVWPRHSLVDTVFV